MRLALALIALLIATPLYAGKVPLGDDGLHKPDWLRLTFKDLSEDLADANDEGKRLMLIWEQRGCIYCTKMHNEVFTHPEIEALIEDNFYVVQLNMFGDEEVTDFDGTVLSEKDMAKRWGTFFTPTILFYDEEVPDDVSGARSAVATMPGAFGKGTTRNLLNFILIKGYNTDEHFQKYHARMIEERRKNSE